MSHRKILSRTAFLALLCGFSVSALAGEADIKLPDLNQVKFEGLGGISGVALMYLGIVICAIGAVFGWVQYQQTKALPVHECMRNVSNTIWEPARPTCLPRASFSPFFGHSLPPA